MSKIFGFKNQLNIGKIGEDLFFEYYSKNNKVEKTDGRIHDFLFNGKTLELKTDNYSMQNTKNFFMEKYGNIDKKALGGAYRALQDKIDYFVYLYLHDKTFFWFNTKALCKFLDKAIINLEPKTIQNKTWAALGYAVPRDICEHLYIRKDVI